MRSWLCPLFVVIVLTVFRDEIGVLTSLPLLRNIVSDLATVRNNGESSLTVYFTKESHIHTLVNLVLLSGLPIANRRIPELDYAVSSSKVAYNPYSLSPSPILHSNYMKEITDGGIQIKSIP